MVLPASGTLTMSQIRDELEDAGSVTIPVNSRWLTLAGKASGSSLVLPNDFWGKAQVEYIGSANVTTVGGTATLLANLGAIGPVRKIVVTLGWEGTTSNAASISSASINGVGALLSAQTSNAASTNAGCGIIVAQVPTGASGNIVVNFNQSDVRIVRISVYRFVTTGTPADTIQTTADFAAGSRTLSGTINVAQGGCVIAVGVTSVLAPVGNITMVGATEQDEATVGANCRMCSGMTSHLNSQAGRTVSINNTVPSGTGGFFLCAVSLS